MHGESTILYNIANAMQHVFEFCHRKVPYTKHLLSHFIVNIHELNFKPFVFNLCTELVSIRVYLLK